MAQPTPKQSRAIWSFCCKYGSAGHDHSYWVSLGKSGGLTKIGASNLIGKIYSFRDAPTPQLKADIETMFSGFLPEFRVVKDPFPGGREKVLPPAPESPKEPQPDGGENPVPEDDGLGDQDEDDKDKVVAMLRKLEMELEKKVQPNPEPKPPVEFQVSPDYIPPTEFSEILGLVKMGMNVLMTGPAGLGKSRLAKELSIALGYGQDAFFCISFGGSMRYPQVFGSDKLVTDENGTQVSIWQPAPLLEAIQRPGVVCIDEVFSCEGDVTNGLNSLLETGTRAIMTPIGRIEAHPECRIVATANTNGRTLSNMYTGVTIQDFSLLNRFIEVKLTYNRLVETEILKRLEDPALEIWVTEKLSNLRKKIDENNISYDASTRQLLYCVKMLVGGLGGERAFELSFLQPLSKAERLKVGM